MTDTVDNQINRIKQNVADVYTALEEHNVELPVLQDSDHMVETINSADFNITGLNLRTVEEIDIDLDEYEIIEIAEQTAKGEIVNQPLTITSNGIYEAEAPYSGLGPVTVRYGDIHLQDVTLTSNGTYIAEAGYTGFGTVIVDTPHQHYLDDIRTALISLGLNPPTDYTQLDTFITDTFNDIQTQLSNINGD